MRVFLDLMWFFRQHKTRYITGIALLIMVALLSLIPPRIVGLVINALTHHQLTHAKLYRDLLIILVTALLTYGIRYLWRIMLFGGAIQLATELRTKLYHHFTVMAPEFYHHKRTGDLMAHSTNDVQAIQETASEGVLTLVDSIVTGSVVITTMAFLNWKLTIVSLLPMPLMAYAVTRYGKMLHDRFYLAQAAFSDINDRVQEYVSGIRVIRAFGQEDWERQNFVALSRDVVNKSVAVARIDSLFDPTISVIVGLSYFLSIAVGAMFVVHGTLNLGNLTTFTLYLGQLIWPMLAFGFLFNIVERGRASYERVENLLAVPATITNKPGAKDQMPSGSVAYAIRQFSYPGSTHLVLRNISLDIEQGHTLGIVGRTGSGKTTLLRLLLREFDLKPEEGQITIGGVSIQDVTLNALRANIAYAPQDAFIFSQSVADNIAFSCPQASREEIMHAAYQAGVLEDIEQFPDGFDTIVGERGTNLSGGQKQRISIARSILPNTEILLLDDTLSAVDARTETHILEQIKNVRLGRTTIIATHRLKTIEHADQIIVLENGVIAEIGTHEYLWSLGGRYWDMYRRQQLETQVERGGVEV